MQKYISVLALFLLGAPLAAFAVSLQGFDIALPNGITITSAGDSSADSMTINSDNVSFELSSGQSIHLVSTNRYKLTNNQNATTGCSSTQSTLDYELPNGVTSVTLTVTPSTDTCSTGGGGGGGGGSGGSGVSLVGSPNYSVPASAVPPTIPTPEVAAPMVQQIPAAVVLPVFNANLRRGNRSDDVTRLQTLLGQDPAIYPEKIASGYFGPKTVAAVKRFQKKYGISQTGIAGPQTRAKLQELYGGATPAIPATPAVPTETSAVPATPAQPAGPGISDLQALIQSLQAQVQALQQRQSAPKPSGGCNTALNSGLICLQ